MSVHTPTPTPMPDSGQPTDSPNLELVAPGAERRGGLHTGPVFPMIVGIVALVIQYSNVIAHVTQPLAADAGFIGDPLSSMLWPVVGLVGAVPAWLVALTAAGAGVWASTRVFAVATTRLRQRVYLWVAAMAGALASFGIVMALSLMLPYIGMFERIA